MYTGKLLCNSDFFSKPGYGSASQKRAIYIPGFKVHSVLAVELKRMVYYDSELKSALIKDNFQKIGQSLTFPIKYVFKSIFLRGCQNTNQNGNVFQEARQTC